MAGPTWCIPADPSPGRPISRLPACLNCGEPLPGRWCPACGQDGQRRLRSLPALLREFAAAVVDLDGRAAVTLRRLLTEPGALTREYAHGRFIRQVPPIRLYLAVSALYFLLSSFVGNGIIRLAGPDGAGGWAQLGPLGWDSEILLLLLIPLWAVAGRLLLLQRTRAFEEVFVFSVHYQIFFLLVVIVGGAAGALLSRVGSLVPVLAVFLVTLLVPLVYLLRALRTAFDLTGIRLVLLATTLFLLHLLGGQLLQNAI